MPIAKGKKISAWLDRQPGPFLAALSFAVVLAVIVPFKPQMPLASLDGSWIFGMNAAVAQGLRLGKDLAFTFGPYASIFSCSYHPATYAMMLLGSLFWAACFAAGIWILAEGQPRWRLAAFTLFLAAFVFSRDSLFYGYAALFCAAVPKLARPKVFGGYESLALACLAAPLGLLPLVKGSSLPVDLGILVLAGAFLCARGRFLSAGLVLAFPAIAMLAFWRCTGQAMGALPDFFRGILPIIAGYGEAMASPGSAVEVLFFLLTATALCLAITLYQGSDFAEKAFLLPSFGLVLFMAFKGGFVRHDGHAMMSGETPVLAALLLGFGHSDRRLALALGLALFTWAGIDSHKAHLSPGLVTAKLEGLGANIFQGVSQGLGSGPDLAKEYQDSLAVIRGLQPLPSMPGSVDIYANGQGALLASGMPWNPRHVLQGYSAYTPELLQLDASHLRGLGAPDSILFKVEPLDGRLPSLEDGSSWPLLFENYDVKGMQDGFAMLRRRSLPRQGSLFIVQQGSFELGQELALPKSGGPFILHVDVQPSALGRLALVLFRSTELRLALRMANGDLLQYRVMSGMMKTGFFISPLVKSTADFVELARGRQGFPPAQQVLAFSLYADKPSLPLWGPRYILQLESWKN